VVVLLPVSAAWLIAMASGLRRQYNLAFHYPAPIVALLMAGLCLCVATMTARAHRTAMIRMFALWIVAATLTAHFCKGFFMGGGRSNRVYERMHPQAKPLLAVTDGIPQNGILLCSQFLAPYCAMRSDIVTWRYWNPDLHELDLMLFHFSEYYHDRKRDVIHRALESEEFGAYRYCFPYVLLRRGHDPFLNRMLLDSFYAQTTGMAMMCGEGGETTFHPVEGLVRYWPGGECLNFIKLVYGHRVTLPAGHYDARFRLGVKVDEVFSLEDAGRLSVHKYGQEECISSVPIMVAESEEFFDQSITFDLSEDTVVEPRVHGKENAALWLKHVGFHSRP
jgi:hypothetical protein